MSVPDPPASRGRRGFGHILGCVVLGCVLAACGSTVPGHPTAQRQQSGTDLAAMLPDQNRFPAGYTTVVVSGQRAAAAAGDLTAVVSGAQIDPPDCAPDRPDPDRLAVVVGTDDETRATITVVLTHTGQPLSALGEQISRCATVRARHGAIDRTISTRLLPPPPANADATLAFARTTTGAPAGSASDPSIRTVFGQIGDVRIETAAMSFGTAQPDTTGMDQVFTAALAAVRTH